MLNSILFYTGDGGMDFPINLGKFLPTYTASNSYDGNFPSHRFKNIESRSKVQQSPYSSIACP